MYGIHTIITISINNYKQRVKDEKGKGFPYSLPRVGPGAASGV